MGTHSERATPVHQCVRGPLEATGKGTEAGARSLVQTSDVNEKVGRCVWLHPRQFPSPVSDARLLAEKDY